MEKEKIRMAAQLADDLKKVNRALDIFHGNEDVAVRVSSPAGNTDRIRFAYLPQSITPIIGRILIEAKDDIIKQMEEL